MTWGVEAAPFVPDSGPRPSGRAVVEQARRRVAAARVRPYNRVAAADIESEHGQFRRHWQESMLNSQRKAAARAREAEAWRQIGRERRQEEFDAARAKFLLSRDRERFYAARRRVRGGVH
jgi:hypothetical protein